MDRIELEGDNPDLFSACSCNDIFCDDIISVIAEITGWRGVDEWHWLVKTNTAYAYIHGGCNYSGWDHHSNCERFDSRTLSGAVKLVPQDERRILFGKIDKRLDAEWRTS